MSGEYDVSHALVLLGGNFPWNLRPLRHYSERICFWVSLVANGVLAVLLVREKNETMKPYSRVLLLNVLFDYAYTVVSMIVEMELEMNEGVYLFVVNGVPRNWSTDWQKFMVAFWMFVLSLTCIVSPVEFIFRYCLVVKKFTMDYKHVFYMACVVVLLSISNSVLLFLAVIRAEDHNVTYNRLMYDAIWWDEGRRPPFYGAAKITPFCIMFLTSIVLELSAISCILTLTTLATLRTLDKQRHKMSVKARYMLSQLNRLMFAEVFSLMSVFVIPFFFAMAFLIFNVKFVGFGVLIALVTEWVPAVNPTTTIFLVGPYRRQLFGRLFRRVFPGDYGHSQHSGTRLGSNAKPVSMVSVGETPTSPSAFTRTVSVTHA